MDKFIKIPVTGRGNMIVRASGVATVIQKSTTTVRVAYVDGTYLTITHAASAAGSEAVRDEIVSNIETILQKGWQTTSLIVSNLSKEVTDVSDLTLST